ncbi:MAG: hypothetical protein NZM06_02210 [Chloroherpetonaceae bacterium]|nr:hypothetical protein [Chloroherpetonaceae bacterium]MDW8438497.1 hypothetical protein [Chloroherpetonaceae bacterium]
MWAIWLLLALVGVLRIAAFIVEEERQKFRGVQRPIPRHLSALDFHLPLKER